MNQSECYSQQEYFYMPQCPYREICPVRTSCPVCPHHQEQYGNMNPWQNSHMNQCGQNCAQNMEMQYQEYAGYGYGNLYPNEIMYGNVVPTGNVNPEGNYHYTNEGYINPDENILNPWDNNRHM